MKLKTCSVIAISIMVFGCGKKEAAESETKGEEIMDIQVSSTAFEEGGMIPAQYTADGANVSPPLTWSGIPEGTKCLALISDDPDAPMGTWVHWVLYNLPPGLTGLSENVPADEELAGGGLHGVNDFRRYGYGGPAPPSGTHRYYLKLYALDAMLEVGPGLNKDELLKAMEGHVLAKGQLMGKYTRR